MREKVIEQYLRERVEAEGGLCYKWVSPGNPGVPDRIVMFGPAAIYFVELKAPRVKDGDIDPAQTIQHRRLNQRGIIVFILNTKARVDAFVDRVTGEGPF